MASSDQCATAGAGKQWRVRLQTEHEISIYAAGAPGYSLPGGVTPGLEHTAYFTPERSTYSNGCHVVEAEVDIWTGQVTLRGFEQSGQAMIEIVDTGSGMDDEFHSHPAVSAV